MPRRKIRKKMNKYVCSHYFLSIAIGVIINFFTCLLIFVLLKNIFFDHSWFTLTRVKLLKLMIVYIVPILLSIYGLIEGSHIYKKKVRIKIPQVNREIRICHLSDIHLGALYRKKFLKKIIRKVKKMNPDLVVITGDLFDGTKEIGLDWLILFNQLEMPIYYVTGNHEMYYGEANALKLVKQTKIHHIQRNEPVIFENLIIYGHNFKENEEVDSIDFFDFCKRIPRKENFVNIVLQHIPSISPDFLVKTNINLVLCGHTHGGPIFPVNLFIHMANSCSKGLYEKQGHYVYVSNGVGTCVTPMRITARSNIDEIIISKG